MTTVKQVIDFANSHVLNSEGRKAVISDWALAEDLKSELSDFIYNEIMNIYNPIPIKEITELNQEDKKYGKVE